MLDGPVRARIAPALDRSAARLDARGVRAGHGDERPLRLTPGLTEGTETVLAYVAFCLFPGSAAAVAWVFAAMVLFTTGQRVARAVRELPEHSPPVSAKVG